jgi:KaiC/GvpD/RAD55 family RecA-like ATPase
MEDLKKVIIEKFKDLPDNFIALATTSTTNYNTLNLAILDYLVIGKKLSGIYLTVNKPCETLISMFKKNNVDIKKLFFIDAISGTLGAKSSAENCKLVQHPSALTELSIQITDACATRAPKFLIFDSLSTMLVYNNEIASVRFIHFLITNLRKFGVAGIIFSMEKDIEKKTLDNIVMFVDKVIKI